MGAGFCDLLKTLNTASCASSAWSFDLESETLTSRGRTLKKGDFVTVDGSSGHVLAGQVPLTEATFRAHQ